MAAASCPRCGSTSARLLTPGYVECNGEVLKNVIPAGMQGNVSDVPLYGRCGHRYQAGTAASVAAQCSCGMFAVAACVRCGEALCGQHLSIRHEQVLCSEHAAEQARADAAVEAAAEVERSKAREIAAAQHNEQVRRADAELRQCKLDIAELARRLQRAGSPGIGPRCKHVSDKQTRFGFGPWRPVYEQLPPGWFVGQFRWKTYRPAITGTFESDEERGVAILDTWACEDGSVEPERGGYTTWTATHATSLDSLDEWFEVRAALSDIARRLTGA
jgi:hypothetical protein